MPRRPVFACCKFCGAEYQVITYTRFGKRCWNWCKCPKAYELKSKLKAEYNRGYRKNLDENGILQEKYRQYDARRTFRGHSEFKGVKIKVRKNICRYCGKKTANFMRCDQCLSKTSWMDTDMAVDVGEWRRLGVRGHSA